MKSRGSNAIQIFVFPVTGQQIRITDRDGKFWYVRNEMICAGLWVTEIQAKPQLITANQMGSVIRRSSTRLDANNL